MQSKDVANKLTDVVANANRGDYRVQVGPWPRPWAGKTGLWAACLAG